MHYINSEEIDAGPIIAIGRFPVSGKDSVLSLHIRNRIIGARLANYVAERVIRKERIQSRPQNGGKYYKLPAKEALRKNAGPRRFRGMTGIKWKTKTMN